VLVGEEVLVMEKLSVLNLKLMVPVWLRLETTVVQMVKLPEVM